MAKRIQLRRDSASNWERINPKLAQGEIGLDLTAKNFKIGDGINFWNDLTYAVTAGKLGSVNSDTYIEIGEGPDAGIIFIVNEGIDTVKITSNQIIAGVSALFNAQEPSLDPYSGTIVVNGGVGISGDLNVGGDVVANSITVEEDIVSDITGNVTGNLFGNVIGDVYSSGGVKILENGTDGTNAVLTGNVSGNITSTGTSTFSNINVSGGQINNTAIGATTPGPITGTTITATTKFQGNLTGNHIGKVYAANGTNLILDNGTNGTDAVVNAKVNGNLVGDVYASNGTSKILENGTDGTNAVLTGNVTGNVTGNITSTGASSFSNVTVTGGSINNTVIGATTPVAITGTIIKAITRFEGEFQGLSAGAFKGDILADDGTSKVLENGTDGTNAIFTGAVVGSTISASGLTTLGAGLQVTGNVQVAGGANFTGNISAPNLLYDGATFAIASTRFTVQATTGDTTIGGDLLVSGDLIVNGTATIINSTTVDIADKNITLAKGATNGFQADGAGITIDGANATITYVDATTSFNINKPVNISGNLTANTATFTTTNTGNMVVNGTLGVTGTTTLYDANITHNATVGGTLGVTGATTLSSTLGVTGDTTLNKLTSGDTTVSTLHVTGNETVDGTLTVTGTTTLGALNAGSSTLNNLAVTTNATVGGTLGVTGTTTMTNATLSGNASVGGTLGVTGATTLSSTLGVTGDTTLNKLTAGNTTVSDLHVTGNELVDGTLTVTGTTTLGNLNSGSTTIDTLTVTNNASIGGTLGVTDDVTLSADLHVLGNTDLDGTLNVDGYTSIDDNFAVTGISTLQKTDTTEINSSGDGFIGGDLTVVGTSDFTGNMTAGNIDASTLDTTGNASIGGTFSVTGASTFTGNMTAGNIDASTLDTTGNTSIGGTFSVTGISTFTGDMTAGNITADNVTVNQNVQVDTDLNVDGVSTLAQVDINAGNIDNTLIGQTTPAAINATDLEADNITVKNEGILKLKEATANGQNYVGFKAPDQFVSSTTYTWPGTKGLDGYILALNTNGDKMEWVSPDLFGGGQVAVSADYGDDVNDGINKPVRTIKRALQIASGLVYDELGEPNDVRIVIAVASGDYVEDNPIIIPDNVSVVGAGLRACNIRPLNANKDMLRVRNGCYFTEITFRDYLDVNKKPYHTFDYAVSFDDPLDPETDRSGYINLPNSKPTITISPYIQNCSIISFLGGNGVFVDGRKVNVPNKPKYAIEAETIVAGSIPQQGKSMVANAFTMLSFGGTGWRVINDAYAQIVSCFQIFCLNGSYCQSGGYLSITNSATNFGQYALRASGYSPNAFEFDRGIVVGTGLTGAQQTITAIGFGNLPVQDYVIRFRTPVFRKGYDLILSNKDELQAALITWINTQISTANASTTPTIWDNLTYDSTKCAEDVDFILDAVFYDLTYGGNLETVVAGLAYYAGASLGSGELDPTLAAYDHLKTVIGKVAQNQYVIPTTGNTEQQTRASGVGSAVAQLAQDLIDDLITYVDPATSDASEVTPSTDWVDNNLVVLSQTMSTQSTSIATSITNNISSTYNSLVYDVAKCQRDIGLVIDAVRYDMMFNSNFRTISAVRSYYRAQAAQVIGVQQAATIDTFTQLKTQLLGLASGNNTAVVRITNCMDLVIGTLINGESSLPNRPYSLSIPTSGTTNAHVADIYKARNLIQSNRTFIIAETIAWINNQIYTKGNIWRNFTYDQVKCNRDVSYVVDAVAYDLLSGGNSRSLEAGTSYANANIIALDRQLYQNIAAFTELKSLVAAVVTDIGLNTYTDDLFDDMLSVLNDPYTTIDSIEYSNVGDITNSFKPVISGDRVTFDASTDIDVASNTFNIVDHGFTNGLKIVYSNESNSDILGLNSEQAYYVDFLDFDNFGLYYDDSLTTKVDIKALGTGTHAFIKNIREFFIDDLISNHNEYQVLTLAAGTYEFVPGRLITGTTTGLTNRAYVYSYDPTTRQLTVSVEQVNQLGDIQRNFFTTNSVITNDHALSANLNISVIDVTFRNDLNTTSFRILPTTTGTNLVNLGSLSENQIWLHRPSIVNSSGHTWEYAGSGIDYNALPQNGGRTRVEFEQVSDLPGRVYSSGTNELGDFKVGDFIKAENKTGNVQFTNTVSIAELDTLKLRIGDIVIQEISADIDLGDNEIGGPKNTRLSTQLAIRSFLENRLGNFIDKSVSTNNFPGAVVQLNSTGKINADLIPPIRNFLIYRSDGYRSRLSLVEDVPPVNILNGDLATETYSTVQLTLDNPITANDGDTVLQVVSGATGIVVGDVNNSTNLIVGSVKDVFAISFDTTNTLTIAGSPSGATPTVVGGVITDQSANYILSELVRSQFLILDPNETYDFTGITNITGAVNKSQGVVDSTRFGVINAVNNLTLTPGSGYNPQVGTATYESVPLTGTGTGALADITVTNGAVSSVDIRRGGTGYSVNDVVSANASDLGGTAITNFSITVSSIQNRLYITNPSGLKFAATSTVPEYIEDANAPVQTITATDTTAKTFSANAVGGNVDYTTSRITISAHGFSDGDPVEYSSGINVVIGGLANSTIYYVKVISSSVIELYTTYALVTKKQFLSSGSGTQTLTRYAVDLLDNKFFVSNHGFTTGDGVRMSGTSLPNSLTTDGIYFVGSVTDNSFSLHTQKSTALDSVNGSTVSALDLTTTGSGTITFTKQNVIITDVVDTSSASDLNWSSLSANNIDAANVVTGVLNSSRLGTGTANSNTFLRGDSTWAKAVQNLKITNTSSPLVLTGNFETNAGVNQYYNSVNLDINLVDGTEGDVNYTNVGVAKFKKSQFAVGDGATLGQVYVKDNVIDAASVNGNNTAYLIDSVNHTTQPVNKGGTALTDYTIGDMIYANGSTSLAKLPIGASTFIMTSTGSAPQWSTNITVNDLTVQGNITQSGSISVLTAYDIRMSDNNIELGSVSAINGRTGTVNDTTASSSTVTMTGGFSTDGMIPGMTLSKVFGTGSFGTNAVITAINSSTQFTFKADTANTIGSINFNIGGASNLTADGGGITVKGPTGDNKTIKWIASTPAWTTSDNFDLPSGKEYKIDQTTVLSSTQVLGKGFTSPTGEIVTSGSYWTRTFALMGA